MNPINRSYYYYLPNTEAVQQSNEDFIRLKNSIQESSQYCFEKVLKQLEQARSCVLDDLQTNLQKFSCAFPHGKLIQILQYLLTIYFSDFHEVYKNAMSQDPQRKMGCYQTYLNMRLILHFLSATEIEKAQRNKNFSYNLNTAEQALKLFLNQTPLPINNGFNRRIQRYQEELAQKQKKTIDKLLGFIHLCSVIKETPELLEAPVYQLTHTQKPFKYSGCIQLQKELARAICFDLNPVHIQMTIPFFIKAWNQGKEVYSAIDQDQALEICKKLYEHILQLGQGIDIKACPETAKENVLQSLLLMQQLGDQYKNFKSNQEDLLPLQLLYLKIMGISRTLCGHSDLIFYNSIQAKGSIIFSPIKLAACSSLLEMVQSLMENVLFKNSSLWELFLPSHVPDWVNQLTQKYIKSPLEGHMERLKSKFHSGLFDTMKELVDYVKKSAQESFAEFDPQQYLNFDRLFSDHLYADVSCICSTFGTNYAKWVKEFAVLAHQLPESVKNEIDLNMSDLAYFFNCYFKDVHRALLLIITLPIARKEQAPLPPQKQQVRKKKKRRKAISPSTSPVSKTSLSTPLITEPTQPKPQVEIEAPLLTTHSEQEEEEPPPLELPLKKSKQEAKPDVPEMDWNIQKLERIDRKLDLLPIKGSLSYRKFIDLLKQLGCTFKEHGGRHEHFTAPNGRLITVPRHSEIKRGTAQHIIKTATEK
jgi:predicted RNA binding protein YcfA (HicA-like mRNA interferase family)